MRQVETIALPTDLSEFAEIIDVRSPGEFSEDHLPGAINLPVLSDTERKEVGSLYVKNPFAARRLGAQLISSNTAAHLAGHFANKAKDYAPLVYCWRGGMRSNSLAHVLRQIGWRARVLDGGYKAFRNWMSADLEAQFDQEKLKFTILAGPTGVAKTRLLHTLRDQGAQVLDLEGLASHRGSVLGLGIQEEQPSQKRFETLLWENISACDVNQPIFTEAESNRIGKLHCPPPLWRKLGQGKVVQIELPLQQRAQFLLDDYPHFTEHPEHLKDLLARLTKLRGSEQVEAWHSQIDSGEWNEFVTSVLENHYDLVYRKAGHEKSNYAEPSKTIQLGGFDAESLHSAAEAIRSFS
ncbi:MAG: tRNA 2-selenouridine(34) synthase MnmH [Akkermansiaceae bacterium]